LLGDLTTGHLTLLASLTGKNIYLEPGQVNGNWATWSSCPDDSVACDVYEYNIAARKTTKVSNTFASGKWQYAPSVSSTGTVYFIHSSTGCGQNVTLNKRALGATRTTLVSFTHGVDIGYGSTFVDDSSGTPVVYYPRYSCATREADVYKVVDK
jgi:hypothetical protein